MKYPKIEVSAAVCNDKILVCGGNCPYLDCNEGKEKSGNISVVECFDSTTSVWTQFDQMPRLSVGHSLVSYGKEILIIGPYNKENNNCVYSIRDKNEKPAALSMPMPYFCIHFGVVALDQKIFVVGGRDQNQKELDRVEIFDGNDWINGPPIPNEIVSPIVVTIPRHTADLLCW